MVYTPYIVNHSNAFFMIWEDRATWGWTEVANLWVVASMKSHKLRI